MPTHCRMAWTPSNPSTASRARPWNRPLRSWSVDGIDWEDERVAVRVRLEGDGLLVLTDQHFPGWEAEVDGEPREILAVDSIYRGVALSGGEHEVVFTYRSRPFETGRRIALVTLVLSLAAFGVLERRRRAHR